MSRTKSDTFDSIFQVRTPERKNQKHKLSEQQAHIKLCSPLPQKEGMNLQSYLILTPNRETLKNNQCSCGVSTPQKNESISYSTCASAYSKSQSVQKQRISFDTDQYYEFCPFGNTIEPFFYSEELSTPVPKLESQKEDITRLRKDSINPHGKDLEMLTDAIQSQQLTGVILQQSSENFKVLDPQLVLQEIEIAFMQLESCSSTFINQYHS
ncbi:hypothetical protein ABPG74_002883 [Tetrahymena malaccensis]